jgi:acetyl/propionyl-CoA carboxylase alpha subunit
MSRPIRKLLVANRAEIAVRVIRAAREMGIRTVAVFSDADSDSMHAALADEAVSIGPGEAQLSYLDPHRILAAAQSTAADAVHPGYGFLSERAEFSEACREAGLIFVGPPPEAMKRIGSKMEAKSLAVDCGVPVVPGHFRPGSDLGELREASESIGYPVLLKASAGGGGRGMRIVPTAQEFDNEFSIASSEAIKAFGDGSMMVEKLIENPRHIEVQVLADTAGNVACLFERECSIQRRHQKLIEESPSPLTGYRQMWPAMREASQKLVRAAGYVGAGTVEFIVDPRDRAFYFLEVNARLQVEHPVTEALDLDAGLIAGDRSRLVGHAIEARVVAEDPARNFLPSVGPILGWSEPSGPGIRVDTGYRSESDVPSFYDSMLAKVIVHAEDRESAVRKLMCALEDFHVLGVKTNIAFLLTILRSDEFQSGQIDTGLVDRKLTSVSHVPPLAGLALIVADALKSPDRSGGSVPLAGTWNSGDGFRNARSSG